MEELKQQMMQKQLMMEKQLIMDRQRLEAEEMARKKAAMEEAARREGRGIDS